jgi:WD40 repeat protein
MSPRHCRLAVLTSLLLAAPLAATPPQDCHGDPLPGGALARMGTTRLRHGDGICHVVYSPDGKFLASLSRDRTCRVWEADSGRLVHLFQEKDVDFYAVAFAPDSATLIASGGDPFHGGNASLRVYDLKTGLEIRRLEGHDQPAYSVNVAPDGRTVLSVSCDQVLRWDAATGDKLTQWRLRSTASLAASPDRSMIAWIDGESEDKTVHLSDAATGKELTKLKGHKRAIVSVAWSPDGRYLASGNPFEPIHLWDTHTGKVVRCLDQQQAGMALKFSADGKLLASGCMDGKVRIWDVATGNEQPLLAGYRGWVNCLAFAPDGKTLALAGADSQVIHRWDVATANPHRSAHGHHGQIYTLDFAPGGAILATGGGDWHDTDQVIYLWESATGNFVRRLEGHTGKVYCVRFSPDGKKLVSGSEREDIFRIWDAATGKELSRFEHKTSEEGPSLEARVSALAWSPDGSRVISAHDQGTLLLWDVPSGKQIRTFKGHEGIVQSVIFSPDGKWLVSGSIDRTVRLWDVESGEECGHFGDAADAVKCVAFSPDGRLLAASIGDYEGAVYVWDFKTSRLVGRLPAPKGRVYQIAFSPDSKLLAGTGGDNALVVWEVATRQERCRFPGHSSGGLALAFAPDGRKIASGSQDTTVMMWELGYLADAARPTAQDLDSLWTDLGSDDAKVAHRAMCLLERSPDIAFKLLQTRLRPISAMDADRLAKVLNDLDHARFPVREKATCELARLGEMAEPFLRQTLDGRPSLEVRRRVEILLSKLETSTLAPDQLRVLRGFEILERLGGADAQGLFEAHARQGPAGRLGQEAQACLRRLAERQR